MTSPEWEAANEDDSDRFPQPSSPHEASAALGDPLQSDPARVARYAQACGDPGSITARRDAESLSRWCARAAVAVAGEEHAALVAEVERLRVMAGPEIIPFTDDQAARIEALSAGKAIGPVEDTEWQVENGDVTRTFLDEGYARKAWAEDGGSLLRVVTTAWVAAEDWNQRAEGDGRG